MKNINNINGNHYIPQSLSAYILSERLKGNKHSALETFDMEFIQESREEAQSFLQSLSFNQ